MNQNLNIEKICQDMELDQKALAEHLFPGNQFSMMALKRVMKGDSLLNSDQVLRLSQYTGLPLEELYAGTWKASSSKERPEIIVYERGKHKAELNIQTWTTTLLEEGVEIDSLIHGPSLSLNEYLADIEKVIENKKS